MATATLAGQISSFTHELVWDQIPDEVRHSAIRHLADTLACAIAAAAEPDADPIEISRRYSLAGVVRPEATIIGSSTKTDLRSAAFVNCTMARYLDANDIYLATRDGGHFSDAIPAILAVAERQESTGRELLEAIVIAYEVQGALAESYLWMQRGFHPVSQVTVGVAAAAGRLLGLSVFKLLHAVSLAVTSGLILQSWLRPTDSVPAIKSGAAGMTAERGIFSAQLAGDGFTGPADALETLFEVLPADADRQPFDLLGTRWLTPRNIIKPVPAQIYTQAVIQCAEQLYRDGLRLDQLASLTVRSNEGTCGRVQGAPEAFAPKTRESADHSTPFVVAMTLRDGTISPATYDGAPWLDADLREAMSRIELISDDEWDRLMKEEGFFGAQVEAVDRSGHRYQAEVDQFAGHPDNPLNEDQLIGKLETFLDRPQVQGAGAGRRLYNQCLQLVDAPSVAGLIGCCTLD